MMPSRSDGGVDALLRKSNMVSPEYARYLRLRQPIREQRVDAQQQDSGGQQVPPETLRTLLRLRRERHVRRGFLRVWSRDARRRRDDLCWIECGQIRLRGIDIACDHGDVGIRLLSANLVEALLGKLEHLGRRALVLE